MNILIMLLPGVPGIYYGQEICMVDGVVRPDQETDYIILPGTTRTRDLARTPMQWDGTLNAGTFLTEFLLFKKKNFNYTLPHSRA